MRGIISAATTSTMSSEADIGVEKLWQFPKYWKVLIPSCLVLCSPNASCWCADDKIKTYKCIESFLAGSSTTLIYTSERHNPNLEAIISTRILICLQNVMWHIEQQIVGPILHICLAETCFSNFWPNVIALDFFI